MNAQVVTSDWLEYLVILLKWSVIPLVPGKKIPCIAQWQKRYSSETKQVRKWLNRFPGANLGLVTGKASGIYVLDVDPRNNGHLSFAELVRQYGQLPKTVTVITPSGGEHYYFKHREGLRNRTAFLPGLDTRGDGGYAAIPPTTLEDGTYYRFKEGCSPSDITLAEMPDWLYKLVSNPRASPNRKTSVKRKKRFSLAEIPEGQRNDTIFRYVCSLLAKGYQKEDIMEQVLILNEQNCIPPLDTEEIVQIVDGATERYSKDNVIPLGAKHQDEESGLPRVVIEKAQRTREIAQEILDNLVLNNFATTPFFKKGKSLYRLCRLKNKETVLEEVTADTLAYQIERSMDCVECHENDDGQVFYTPVSCPTQIIKDILSSADFPFPELNGVVKAPIYAPNGQLLTAPGYNAEAEVWYQPYSENVIPAVSAQPTSVEVQQASSLLLDQLLYDFPFDSQASRANALAAMILPAVRFMIDGPTPANIIEAPTPGTGKSLLLKVLGIPYLGREPNMLPEPHNEAEWSKVMLSTLIQNPPFVMFDNINRSLKSTTLAMALTSRHFEARILGLSKNASLSLASCWFFTGNNIELSSEIARRSVRIRLVPDVERPWQREGFKIKNILEYAKEHSSETLWAIYTLVQNWIAQGQPKASLRPLGTFEQWSRVMGGILFAAGIKGFLDNADELYRQVDDDLEPWRAFIHAFWLDQPVSEDGSGIYLTSSQIFKEACEKDYFQVILGNGNERSQQSKLGKALRKLKDRIIDHYKIEYAFKNNHRTSLYRLVDTQKPPHSYVF